MRQRQARAIATGACSRTPVAAASALFSDEKSGSLGAVFRAKVSKNKFRYQAKRRGSRPTERALTAPQEDGFDLDLSYITDNIIAMGATVVLVSHAADVRGQPRPLRARRASSGIVLRTCRSRPAACARCVTHEHPNRTGSGSLT